MINKRKLLIIWSKRLVGKTDWLCESTVIWLKGFQMELENRYRVKIANFLEEKWHSKVQDKFKRLKYFLKIETKKIHFTIDLYDWYLNEYSDLKDFLESCCW